MFKCFPIIITVNASWLEDRTVCLRSQDDRVRKYPGVWIRDNCQCPKCFDQSSQQRMILMKDFDPEVIPSGVKLDNHHVILQLGIAMSLLLVCLLVPKSLSQKHMQRNPLCFVINVKSVLCTVQATI